MFHTGYPGSGTTAATIQLWLLLELSINRRYGVPPFQLAVIHSFRASGIRFMQPTVWVRFCNWYHVEQGTEWRNSMEAAQRANGWGCARCWTILQSQEWLHLIAPVYMDTHSCSFSPPQMVLILFNMAYFDGFQQIEPGRSAPFEWIAILSRFSSGSELKPMLFNNFTEISSKKVKILHVFF